MRLIEIRTPAGTVRACTSACYAGNPETASKCKCICAGKLHGIGREAADEMTTEALMVLREQIPLAEGETVQLRIGA